MKDKTIYTSNNTWVGRSLTNYISMHPQAKGAKTLTEARKMAFGYKKKNTRGKAK